MVDRDARDKLVGIIQDYLDERITAFAFDEQINELALATADETVEYVVRMLWYHYDDLKDHKVVLSKPQWNYFQRLLLLLRSDASVHVERFRVWSWGQGIAAALFVCFWAAMACFGWGWYLLGILVPVGAGSIALSRYSPRSVREEAERQIRLMPFESVRQVFSLRRRLPGFRKRPYPATLSTRRIRSVILEARIKRWYMPIWVLFAPVVLLFQLFPASRERTIVGTC